MVARIDRRFERLAAERRAALVAFIMAGDPDPETSLAILKALPRAGADVVEYRDMVTIVRDRVQDAIKRGLNLEQTKAAKLTLDYDPQYGSGDAFVESIYKSLGGK